MRRAVAWTCLAALALAGRGRAQEVAPQPLGIDLTSEEAARFFFTHKNLSSALGEVWRTHGDIVRLESMGRSAAGFELHVVTLARLGDDDPSDRPALLVVGALGAEDLFGTELALATLRRVMLAAGKDPEVDEILDHAVIYLVPCLDAERRERAFEDIGGHPARSSLRAVALDRNFPVDWNPLVHSDAGPFPLSERESRALAQFLLARPNIAATQSFRLAGPRRAPAEPIWPSADREIARRIGGDLLIDGLDALDGADGSWLRFAYAQQGALVFSAPVSFARNADWALPQLIDLPRLEEAAAATTLRLARGLPRLRTELVGLAKFGEGQWKIDIEVVNSGRMPTASAQARARRACAAPRLELEGAELLGLALLGAGNPTPLAAAGQVGELPEIAGEARLKLCLFVSGTPDASVSIAVSAPRAGRATATAVLR